MLLVLQRQVAKWPLLLHHACSECGGAMEKAKCLECGTKVGGTMHQLLQGNQFAPEMDGASHPACHKLPTYPNLTQTNFNIFLVCE